ncbi:MAG TPA: OmpA family protein [Terriglobales bacterium]|nr:OmpA family protein [Terriglobales bacterium]
MPVSSRISGFQTRYLALGALAAAMVVAGGCTTKNYVRQQTAPLIDHVNQLDTETAKNTNAIKDVDQRTQKSVADANASSQKALEAAQQVQGQAQQVSSQLNQTSGQVQALDATMANLDNYTQSSEATVHFAFDKADLTPEAQQTLDGVVSQLEQNAHGILEVEGYTDSTGPATYNNKLSQRRADSVVRYLESKNIAPHRIFLIGLGENQAVAPNTTKTGRQQNRRVDLKVLSNTVGSGE